MYYPLKGTDGFYVGQKAQIRCAGRRRHRAPPSPLTQAMHQARVEAAERTSVVVDLRDAEVARLELLNEALDPLFAEIPPEAELFDRGISRGDTPRLWIDSVAHVAMGRDKRAYRFLHDTRIGRRVLAKSHEIPDIVQAVTTYVARRLVERQRALDEDPEFITRVTRGEAGAPVSPPALAHIWHAVARFPDWAS